MHGKCILRENIKKKIKYKKKQISKLSKRYHEYFKIAKKCKITIKKIYKTPQSEKWLYFDV